MLATPKGAGIAAAWGGLKTNQSVIGTAKVLDSICQEIDADLQMEDPPRRLKDLNLKIGTDGGGEMTSPDFERVVKKWNMRQELGAPGRPMSQALAESHVGVWDPPPGCRATGWGAVGGGSQLGDAVQLYMYTN
jgi:hypothetical protein